MATTYCVRMLVLLQHYPAVVPSSRRYFQFSCPVLPWLRRVAPLLDGAWKFSQAEGRINAGTAMTDMNRILEGIDPRLGKKPDHQT